MDVDLDGVADEWQLALDRAALALDAADGAFPGDELRARRRQLVHERAETAHDLAALASELHVRHRPWLAPFPVHASLLGVPGSTRTCIFDLEGVLTDSGLLHATAWSEAFDDLLLRRAEQTGWQFIPFDPVADYAAYLDGRPRLEGIRLFLGSRGIRLSHEEEDALARHKSEVLGRRLRQRGVSALPGARRYLEAAGHAGLGRAVVSSSTRTLPVLELAELAGLVDARVDAEQIAKGSLRSRPAPDLILRACDLLGVEPAAAVCFAHTPDGVAAARAAAVAVVGVAMDEGPRERLRAFGADRTVARLGDLLDPRLATVAAGLTVGCG
jgi:HAD superfamily hydrolase (TIGR01509 family)